ncbi:heme lyase NrfEFG subunit NrfE [Actinobacillus succinogenes]|uniref:Cytochrome c-type biogenesis protein CcmF n=1 Tax=Actinobacillus succinogenes (strain ATCC 55618 / DSM 22257 / CCUG 43843 / 130Z) TaxID=339671 RepID=A6VM84_ACTSZ|nr:heme lyase NrfEFG subunit NrfE [Actinobacillus succinogenes]ABR74081.1 cytochrome c-type biogenesis protein CcmF [Actinobacillus succinogenes 130Z]PHI39485.1 heme lyase NrfEFG subunit NrfE [Actinobacillus succinogenes]
MLPELAFLALIIATLAFALLAVCPTIGKPQYAWNLSYVSTVFTTVSIGILAYSFAVDDFSVEYVAAHSNSQLPTFFKIAATWGGHEGSMLFWLFSLSIWVSLFAFFSRKIDPVIASRTLSVLGLLCLGFGIFIVFFSNPFIRQFPLPPEGRDLNPMLQDIGLIFHPPLLYLGYVGFAVNFALTIAALISGHVDAAVARWMRPWALVSWFFLTVGIVLGAWWAYYELGWGGWWFWDPVENASLMPWLLGLGLLHSLIVTEQRGVFGYWTILYSLLTFAFSLLGTFIVRSGVLTSVHAFAVDGERGSVLLILFFLITVSSLTLFAVKTNLRQSAVRFSFVSKETLILLANILFAVAMISVFIGTFYPMLFTAMGWGSISVGAPYFNSIFLPLIVILLIAMVVVLATKWQKVDRVFLFKRLACLLPSVIVAYALIRHTVLQEPSLKFNPTAFALLSLAVWLFTATIWTDWRAMTMKRAGMVLAHCGVAVTTIGAVMSGYFGSEFGVRLAPGQSQQLNGYDFRYFGFTNEIGPNYTSEKAHFEVVKNGEILTALYPERRYYDVRTMNMSEVGINWGLLGDIYIVMGDKLTYESGNSGEFTFRLHYKPFVGWLWLGGMLMAIGALCAALSLKRNGGKKE